MGLLDTVCYPPIMYKAAIYFEKYIGSNATIKNVFDIPSEHGYVSPSRAHTNHTCMPLLHYRIRLLVFSLHFFLSVSFEDYVPCALLNTVAWCW